MDIRNTMNYSLFALLSLTALIAGKSVDGYPAGGAQEGAGDEWAADAIAVSYTHLTLPTKRIV